MLILLLNAIKFTTNGTVEVKAKMVNGNSTSSSQMTLVEEWLEVTVKDTGMGISEAD